MPLSELQQVRLDKARHLRDQGIDPYPTTAERTHTAAEALAAFTAAESAEPTGLDEDGTLPIDLTLVGRVVAQRQMGKSLFMPVEDGSGRLQLYLRKQDLAEGLFDDVVRLYDLGDFVQASGRLFRTRTGEVSLRVSEIRMLSKALNAPPEKYHGLTDIETRYRRRYADLISNEEVRKVFVARARIVSAIRRELDARGYLEVETPTLQPLYGGAAARPFTTLHNALDQTFYLRIADELYLKRLIVGGYERVYEICKDFRNEGIDRFHSPEFTMIEFYEAYADYTDMMGVVESLIVAACVAVHGEPRFPWQGQTIDLSAPWPRKTLRQAIIDGCGVDYAQYPEQADLLAAARAAGADVPTDTVWPKIVDELLKQFVRPHIVQPVILHDYPVSLSPLAKRRPDDPTHAERFQPFFCGGEVGNAFTELNDPMDQLARFRAQEADKAAGDEETMPIDADYVNALMYGMPPTGGVGIGIDRLTMLLTDQDTLRDVVLFPAMRNLPPEQDPAARTIEGLDPVAQGIIPPIG
ncbi:MAG TPA: lysine--tRNA ligase [Thermomicrobiales bacterium]|jgi:lysyl-tRNA synthetase class 2|nr:lysine--tRNA ligase [Thermomicrobiales bacterium]